MPFDFSVVTAPFRMQPGLRRLAHGEPQLTPNAPGARALREKLAILGSFAHQALVTTAGFDAGPALAALAEESSRATPSAWTFESAERCAAPRLGWALVGGEPVGDGDADIGTTLRRLPPSQRAAALVSLAFAEDFAIVDSRSGTVPWLAVCLPSRWAPETRVGLHFSAIHAPVADGALLIAAADRLVQLVSAGERWERFVWTLSPDPRLSQHPARADAAWDANADPSVAAWFRHERQTFIPIPATGQAVFTIRIDSEPLAHAVTRPADAARLHDALQSMSPAVIAYRGLGPVRESLLRWLSAKARSGHDTTDASDASDASDEGEPGDASNGTDPGSS